MNLMTTMTPPGWTWTRIVGRAVAAVPRKKRKGEVLKRRKNKSYTIVMKMTRIRLVLSIAVTLL